MTCDKITNQQIKSKTANFKHKVQVKMTIRNLKRIMLNKSYIDVPFLTVLAYNYAHFVNFNLI